MAEEQGFFEDKNKMLGTALILSLISFFLLNFGVRGIGWAYWLGLVLLFGGLFLAPLSRFTAGKRESKEESSKEE